MLATPLHRFRLIALILGLLGVVVPSGGVWAQQWEVVGPSATSAGLTAVATDPQDPRIVWVASTSSVWVSDDGGASFELVLQLSRSAVQSPEDEPSDEAIEEALDDAGLDAGAVDLDSDEALEATESIEESSDSGDSATDPESNTDEPIDRPPGISRLRVLGDYLFVCTSRGLYRIPRAARRLGDGNELRFGRRARVLDVARTPDGRLWIGTDSDLLVLDSDGLAWPARGFDEELEVRSLLLIRDRLVAATSRGLRIATAERDGFDRLSLGDRDERGLTDLAALPEGRGFLVAGPGSVARVTFADDALPVVEDQARVPGVSRVLVLADGAMWAVGSAGAWQLVAEVGWQRASEGMSDRRLVDAAPGDGVVARLWAVGRAGAWRFSLAGAPPPVARSARAQALAGWPTLEDVRRWAEAERGLTLGQIDGWGVQERLSWLLPTVEFRARWGRRRVEDYPFIPTVGTRYLDAVEVSPRGDDLLVLAVWDVMPALTAALEGARPIYETARIRARRGLDTVRNVVQPAYQAWAQLREEQQAQPLEARTVRDEVKALLTLQRLEATLHVYTGGRFPVGREPNRP